MERTDPVPDGDERTLLEQYLDYHRATLLQKVAGLTKEQLAQRLEPSPLTLAGLLKHMALVEDTWFDHRLAGNPERDPWAGIDWEADPNWEFRTALDDEPAALVRMYEEACERSRAAIRAVEDLGTPTRYTRRGADRPVNARWILLHMIEETARHNGHADLLRESIDGVTGD